MLVKLGAVSVSADDIAREAVAPGTAVLQQLCAYFGESILNADGTLNRDALAGIVFFDPAARAMLNRITHPAIGRLAEQKLSHLQAAADYPLIVYEAPLLFEAGAESRVDQVLVVTVEPEIQLQRLIARDGIDHAEATARVAAQMPLTEKIRRADYLINNSGSLVETEAQVRRLYRELTRRAPE